MFKREMPLAWRVSMPRMTGLQAAAELSPRARELRCLMLSMHKNRSPST
jgi:DNA-binding NarL/FixJ family response regulator